MGSAGRRSRGHALTVARVRATRLKISPIHGSFGLAAAATAIASSRRSLTTRLNPPYSTSQRPFA
jgi:hypothetical protein